MPKVILKGFIIVSEPDLNAVKAELINHKRLTLAECIFRPIVTAHSV
ncbi:hypothetical protein BDK62_13219 [Halomonas alkaliantarctica]|nr:hypothetical protein BDK62_13219 [Halomonas alkaliantarctica]